MAASDSYPVGECTFYVAERFPSIYGHMGNAQDWVKTAVQQGYPLLSKPLPDTVAVFGPGGKYSSLGHVAVVDSVNADGSYNVSEMNYAGWDQVDQRRVMPGDALGFIVPPGSMLNNLGSTASIPADYFMASNNSGGCITRWNLPFGTSLCMDGIIGGAAMAAGGAVMLAGTLVLVALAITGSKIGRSATGALATGAKPIGAVVQHQQQQKARATQSAQQRTQATQQAATVSHQEAIRRSQLRISRARARVAEGRARNTGMSAEDKERATERRIAATGRRPEPGTVKRGLAA